MKNNKFLAIDIGNTNITVGVYSDEVLEKTFRMPTSKKSTVEDYVKEFKSLGLECLINSSAIASVVDELNEVVKKSVKLVFNIEPKILAKEDFKLKTNLLNPSEAGIDRLANAYSAKQKYPLPLIVVDIGTATTFDIVSKEGVFLGGVIMPGVNLQLEALNLHTSKLPRIDAMKSDFAIGNSTKNAILSGVIRGSACAIEGLINQCEHELNAKATVIATGGLSGLIAEYMIRKFDFVEPNLTLNGIRLGFNNSHVNLY